MHQLNEEQPMKKTATTQIKKFDFDMKNTYTAAIGTLKFHIQRKKKGKQPHLKVAEKSKGTKFQ